MKTSAFFAVAGAALAMAGPINKRAMETEWVWDVVTVTVTEDDGPCPEPTEATSINAAQFVEQPTTTTTAAVEVPTTTKEHTYSAPPPPPPAPAPTTSTSISYSSSSSATTSTSVSVSSTSEAPVIITTSIAPSSTAPAVVNPQKPSSTVSTSAAPSSTSSPDVDSYAQAMLQQHNEHRANHSSPDLAWSEELASWAKNTAETCVFAHDMTQGDGNYGQNLATYGSSADISAAMMSSAKGAVTDQWYNGEMMSWDYYGMDDPPAGANLEDWGHFTQVVWKSSTKVGCYTQKCAAGTVLSYPAWYTVCNYDPAGNFGGQYGKNVLRPLGAAIASV